MARRKIELTEEEPASADAAERQVSRDEIIQLRAKAAAGRFSSGASDGSVAHDRYLDEAFDHSSSS